jgi:predicted enzyme related to lactoylglutathione lyase
MKYLFFTGYATILFGISIIGISSNVQAQIGHTMDLHIQHVEIHTPSLSAAKGFYVQLLGLEVLEENPAIQLIALKAGNVRISIMEVPAATGNQDSPVHLVFATQDIQATYDDLVLAGAVPVSPITEAPGFCRFFGLRDPDGNLVEMAQYLRDPLVPRR